MARLARYGALTASLPVEVCGPGVAERRWLEGGGKRSGEGREDKVWKRALWTVFGSRNCCGPEGLVAYLDAVNLSDVRLAVNGCVDFNDRLPAAGRAR